MGASADNPMDAESEFSVELVGRDLMLDLRNRHEREYKNALVDGSCEPQVVIDRLLFSRLIRNGDWVLDAGANIGVTALFAIEAGAARVHCVEPVPAIAARLKRLAGPQIEVTEAALSDAAGRGQLFVSSAHNQGSTLSGDAHDRFKNIFDPAVPPIEVDLMTIDQLMHATGRGFDVWKLDIEGAEVAAVRGAARHVAQSPPRVVLAECYDADDLAALRGLLGAALPYCARAFVDGGRKDVALIDWNAPAPDTALVTSPVYVFSGEPLEMHSSSSQSAAKTRADARKAREDVARIDGALGGAALLSEALARQLGRKDAAGFLLEALSALGPLPPGALSDQLANVDVPDADPKLYGNFRRDLRQRLESWKQDRVEDQSATEPPVMLDFGGGAGENVGIRSGFRYIVADIAPGEGELEALVHDLNTPLPFADASVDVVYSNQVFEHLTDPAGAIAEIGRVLRPGGVCFASTVFSYRYHPFPGDFWRFTHEGLRRLFEDKAGLETEICRYELTHRRDDRRGALGHADEAPVDWLGGFRENWFVYFIGHKS